MSVIKKPDLSDPKLRAKLAKGMVTTIMVNQLGLMIFYTFSLLLFLVRLHVLLVFLF
jgi:hypothetical protein